MHDPWEGVNADGTIRTGVGRERVPTTYEPVIAAALGAFEAVVDDCAELHLYGSVANGTARPGQSDVDLVAINVPEDWARKTEQRLSVQFSDLCRGVAVGRAANMDYLADGDEMAMLLAWADDESIVTVGDLADALAPGGIVANVVERFRTTLGMWS